MVFQKSPSKDIGLIVSEEIYRCDSFSGVCHYTFIQSVYIFCIMQLLVLGFEYNTKAEYLITCGQIRVLDVITSLNDKKVSPLIYKDQVTKNRSCSLELNTSIALPQLKPLMDKGTFGLPGINVIVFFFYSRIIEPNTPCCCSEPKRSS